MKRLTDQRTSFGRNGALETGNRAAERGHLGGHGSGGGGVLGVLAESRRIDSDIILTCHWLGGNNDKENNTRKD